MSPGSPDLVVSETHDSAGLSAISLADASACLSDLAERQEVAPVDILATYGPSRNIPNGDTFPKSPAVPAFAAVAVFGDTVLPHVGKEHLVRVSAATEWLLADVVSW